MNDTFYITGGTLPVDAGSYVPRDADAQLFDGLLRGEFCYVLDTRQMGKSSLMLRTARKLREEGCRVAVLDLTAVGQNLTVEQWYFGLLARMVTSQQPKQADTVIAFWKANPELGPMQRFVEVLYRILLMPSGGDEGTGDREVTPLVIFVDEIDAVRSLPFSVDEFFGGIRECYNRRRQEPAFEKLTFCLLGVAAPTDLVRDTRLSPFNIGRRVELHDFTPEEAAPLAKGLADAAGSETRALRLLFRVLYWTNGHPYMTQRLCYSVAKTLAGAPPQRLPVAANRVSDKQVVDRACHALFLAQDARDTDDNLLFVRNRLLHNESEVSAVLDLYSSVWGNRRVRDDATNPLCSLLRLSGVASRRGPYLMLRNRIYRTVFDRAWVRDHLPDAELRRQKAAYRAGVLRTASVSGGILLCIGTLAGVTVQQARVARRAENTARQAEKRATVQESRVRDQLSRGYVENAVRLMAAGDYGAALAPLASAASLDKDDPARFAIHQQRFASVEAFAPHVERFWSIGKPVRWATYSPNKRQVAAGGDDGMAHLWNAQTGAEIPLLGQKNTGPVTFVAFSPDGTRLVACGMNEAALVWETKTGKRLFVLPTPPHGSYSEQGTHAEWSRDGRRLAVAWGEHFEIWDVGNFGVLSKPKIVFQDTSPRAKINKVVFSPDGTACVVVYENFSAWYLGFTQNEAVKIGSRALGGGYVENHAAWSRDGKRILMAGEFGEKAEHIGATVFNTALLRSKSPNANVLPLLSHSQYATWAEFSPDETRIATSSLDGTARLWNAQTGQPLTPPLRHERPVTQIGFSPSGRRVVTASLDGTARIWNAQTGQPLCAPLHHAGGVVTAQFGDENHVLTASRDGTVRVWAIPHPAPILRKGGKSGNGLKQWDSRFIALRSYLLCVGENDQRNVALYDLSTRTTRFPPLRPQDLPLFTRFKIGENDKRFVLYNGSPQRDPRHPSQNAQVRDVATGRAVSPNLQADGLTLSHDENRLLLANNDGLFRLVDVFTGRLVFPPIRGVIGRWTQPENTAYLPDDFSSFTPDDKRLILSPAPTLLRFYDTSTGRPVGAPMPHGSRVDQWRISPTGKYLFSHTVKGEVRVWNATDDTPASVSMANHEVFFEGANYVERLAFSPNGRFALTAGRQAAYLWPLSGPRIVPQKLPLPQTTHFIFSPDSQRFVALNQTAWLWRVGETAALSSDTAYTTKVIEAVFSSDSRRVLVIRKDGTAAFWDAKTAHPVTRSLGQPQIYRAAFNPDGRTAATLSRDGTVRVWDAVTGEPVTPRLPLTMPYQGESGRVSYTADGKNLVVEWVGNVAVWRLDDSAENEDGLLARAQLLSGQRQDANLGTVPVDNAALTAAWQRIQTKRR